MHHAQVVDEKHVADAPRHDDALLFEDARHHGHRFPGHLGPVAEHNALPRPVQVVRPPAVRGENLVEEALALPPRIFRVELVREHGVHHRAVVAQRVHRRVHALRGELRSVQPLDRVAGFLLGQFLFQLRRAVHPERLAPPAPDGRVRAVVQGHHARVPHALGLQLVHERGRGVLELQVHPVRVQQGRRQTLRARIRAVKKNAVRRTLRELEVRGAARAVVHHLGVPERGGERVEVLSGAQREPAQKQSAAFSQLAFQVARVGLGPPQRLRNVVRDVRRTRLDGGGERVVPDVVVV